MSELDDVDIPTLLLRRLDDLGRSAGGLADRSSAAKSGSVATEADFAAEMKAEPDR